MDVCHIYSNTDPELWKPPGSAKAYAKEEANLRFVRGCKQLYKNLIDYYARWKLMFAA